MIILALLILAAVAFWLAALKVPERPRLTWVPLGWALLATALALYVWGGPRVGG